MVPYVANDENVYSVVYVICFFLLFEPVGKIISTFKRVKFVMCIFVARIGDKLSAG